MPATGRRFTLEGIYTPDGKPLDTARFQEPEALALMATSMSLPVNHTLCHENHTPRVISHTYRIRGPSRPT